MRLPVQMRLGIVGSEAIKFTPVTQDAACRAIADLILKYNPTEIISGGCHLGGIDIWAVEIAQLNKIPFREFKPKALYWPEYKKRNILIAENSDVLVCITVKNYPPNYHGMRFTTCYHCNSNTHIKSGGCWTMHYASRKFNTPTELIVIE